MSTRQAAVWRSPGKYEVIEVADPKISEGEVLVQVKVCGICGTDKIVTNFLQNGMIQGHEGAGVVVEGKGTNAEGKEIKKDDRVFIKASTPCGKCHFCRASKANLCENRTPIGRGFFGGKKSLPGTWAEYIRVPTTGVLELPPEVEFEESIFDAVALAGINRSWNPRMRNTMIMGMGAVGLLALQFIVRRGVEKIIAVDISDTHLKLAEKFGATHTINNKTKDLFGELGEITGGLGVDLIINTVEANKEILNELLKIIKKQGTITCISEGKDGLPFDYSSLVHKQVVLKGVLGGESWYTLAILRMIGKGLIDTKSLVTHKFPLKRIQEAFNFTYKPESIKVIMIP